MDKFIYRYSIRIYDGLWFTIRCQVSEWLRLAIFDYLTRTGRYPLILNKVKKVEVSGRCLVRSSMYSTNYLGHRQCNPISESHITKRRELNASSWTPDFVVVGVKRMAE